MSSIFCSASAGKLRSRASGKRDVHRPMEMVEPTAREHEPVRLYWFLRGSGQLQTVPLADLGTKEARVVKGLRGGTHDSNYDGKVLRADGAQ